MTTLLDHVKADADRASRMDMVRTLPVRRYMSAYTLRQWGPGLDCGLYDDHPYTLPGRTHR